MSDIAQEFERVLLPDGQVFLNMGYTNKKPWTATDVASEFRKHLELQNRITWVKSVAIDNVTHGQFKPINSDRFTSLTNEEVFHFTLSGNVKLNRKAAGVPFTCKENLKRFGHAEEKRCGGNTWYIPYKTVTSKKVHPAAFPVELPLRCLRLADVKTGVVMDPFVGSGTTLLAMEQYNEENDAHLTGLGIDISEVYLKIATPEKKSAQKKTPQKAGKADRLIVPGIDDTIDLASHAAEFLDAHPTPGSFSGFISFFGRIR